MEASLYLGWLVWIGIGSRSHAKGRHWIRNWSTVIQTGAVTLDCLTMVDSHERLTKNRACSKMGEMEEGEDWWCLSTIYGDAKSVVMTLESRHNHGSGRVGLYKYWANRVSKQFLDKPVQNLEIRHFFK